MDVQEVRAPQTLFGRQRGKKLRGQQASKLQTVYPKISVDLNSALSDIKDLFPETKKQYRMEIGFGGGEHLLHQVSRNPETGFIGAEPFQNGMAKFVSGLEDPLPNNIRVHDHDATDVLNWLPDNSLNQIDLLYPDPWPKKKHFRRRFVSMENLDRISRVLKKGGKFCFASDIESYVNWTLAHCERHNTFKWLAESADDWRLPYEGWTRTRYEAKAIREERTPCYLTFERI